MGLSDFQIYYDRQGRPVSREEGIRLMESDERQVACDDIGDATVSTVHLVINHQFDPTKPPLIFETMIFGGPYSDYQWRYPTVEAALAGHDRVMAALRDNEEP